MTDTKKALHEAADAIIATRDGAFDRHEWANQNYKDYRDGWNDAVDFAVLAILERIKDEEASDEPV